MGEIVRSVSKLVKAGEVDSHREEYLAAMREAVEKLDFPWTYNSAPADERIRLTWTVKLECGPDTLK